MRAGAQSILWATKPWAISLQWGVPSVMFPLLSSRVR